MSAEHVSKASHHASPLRYPGGKGKLARYVKAIVRSGGLMDSTYIEPFAGGAGVGLTLLLHGYVKRIVLNDLSLPIYSFWRALLDDPDKFKARIESVPLTTEEWTRQREIFRNHEREDAFDVGFSAFFLNRTNVSGVLNGGMIGGYAQAGTHGISARFNRTELALRVERIARHSGRIDLRRDDAALLIGELDIELRGEKRLFYLDPPYYRKGRDLYYDFYRDGDHRELRDRVAALDGRAHWIVSYDNEPEIRNLYAGYQCVEYDLSYSVKNGRIGREVMFFSANLTPPALSEGGLSLAPAPAGLYAPHPELTGI